MNKFLSVISIALVLCFYNCQSTDNQSVNKEETVTVPPQTIKAWNSISREKMTELWQNCTSIDYIIMDQPFSISTENQAQSRSLLRHVSTDSTAVYEDCKITARISYVGASGILQEAEFFFSDTNPKCNYFVFYEGGKPAYANKITQEGYDYYKQVFSNVQVQSGQ